MDVDEPLSDHQKALRERASSSISSLQKSLSYPVSPPKDDYNYAVNRLRHLLDRYEATKLSSPTETKKVEQPILKDDSSGVPDVSGLPKPDELAPLFNDQHAILQHLEQQVTYYKNALASVRQKTEVVIRENEELHHQLKDQIVSRTLNNQTDDNSAEEPSRKRASPDAKHREPKRLSKLHLAKTSAATDEEETESEMSSAEPPLKSVLKKTPKKSKRLSQSTQVDEAELNPSSCGQTTSVSFMSRLEDTPVTRKQFDQDTTTQSDLDQVFMPPSQRRFVQELEGEVEKIRGLHQAKTRRLESLLYSTRDELEDYKAQVSKLQEKLRQDDARLEQCGQPSVCMKCAKQEALMSPRHGNINMKTIEKLSRERDELMETLTNQKKSFEDVRQRELESYMQVKQSCDMVEQAQLEKAEIMIQVQQLKDELRQQRDRHEKYVTTSGEKLVKESEKTRQAYQNEIDALNNKMQTMTDDKSALENQMERITREKVDLTTELEGAKAQILAHKAQMESVTEEMLCKVNEAVKMQSLALQEVDSMKMSATQSSREREQEKIRLTTQMAELRRRLQEAEQGWMENKEECIRMTERMHNLEKEAKTATTAKDAMNKSRLEELHTISLQSQHREQQLTVLLEEAETRNSQTRMELELMLESQMEVANRFREECKRLNKELEDNSSRTRSEFQQTNQEVDRLRGRLEDSLKKQRFHEVENAQSSKIVEQLSEKLRQADATTKKYSKQTYDLLSKQTNLMKDRQLLCRELEYLRAQVMKPPHPPPATSGTVTPDDISA